MLYGIFFHGYMIFCLFSIGYFPIVGDPMMRILPLCSFSPRRLSSTPHRTRYKKHCFCFRLPFHSSSVSSLGYSLNLTQIQTRILRINIFFSHFADFRARIGPQSFPLAIQSPSSMLFQRVHNCEKKQ